MASGIKEFKAFMEEEIKKKVLRAYKKYRILSEADLEAYLWWSIKRFLPTLKKASPKSEFSVHCKPYLKALLSGLDSAKMPETLAV